MARTGAANGAGKAQSGQLKDFLDLAVSRAPAVVGRGKRGPLTMFPAVLATDCEGIWSLCIRYQCRECSRRCCTLALVVEVESVPRFH